MNCNCDENTILCTEGTSLSLRFDFGEDISSFTNAIFVVRKNADSKPVIAKTVSGLVGNGVDIALTPAEMENFTFDANKNQATYIWGLDLMDATTRVNIYPKTGEVAPLFVVYKHIAEE